jgi:hypothetical protein
VVPRTSSQQNEAEVQNTLLHTYYVPTTLLV